MNKLRRKMGQIPFPKVDMATGHQKGEIPGNMMGYSKKGEEPVTNHVPASTHNMMGYKKERAMEPQSNTGQVGGPAPKKDTRSGLANKTETPGTRGWTGYDANNPEWTKIQSPLKKKNHFYN